MDDMYGNLEAALGYLKRGWSIVPAFDKNPGCCLPSWKQYQTRLPTEDEVRGWWQRWPDAQVGVVTGQLSGVVVIDLDVGFDRERYLKLEVPPSVFSNTPSGGQHVFLKHPGVAVKTCTDLFDNSSYIDIRGDGGFAVLPPSKNSAGDVYTWGFSPDDCEIAAIPDALLKLTSSSQQDTGATDWPSVVCGVSEGSRNDTAAKIIGKLLQRFPLAEWENFAWPQTQSWNRNNAPPLAEKELRQTFDSIARNELKSRGGERKGGEVFIESVPLKELLEKIFPEQNWAIADLFETGTMNMLSAAPNQYKSWIALHMAASIAKGQAAFGHFPVTQCPVMVVNEEDSARQLKERMIALLGGSEDLPIFIHYDKGFSLKDETVALLLAEAKNKGIGFVIFDSLRSLHQGDENDSKEMQMVMDQFKKFTREGITVLFTHHNRKRSGFMSGGDGAEDARGSTAINAAVHGHITCEPKEIEGVPHVVINQRKLKGAKKIKPFSVLVKEEPGRLGFEYVGEYLSADEASGRVKKSLLEIFPQSETWLSVKDLLEMGIGKARAIRDALKALVSEEILVSLERHEAEDLNKPIKSPKGKRNEKLYFRA